MILEPCIRFENNTPLQQLNHVASELQEVIFEIEQGNNVRAAEEIIDVMVSCRTLLHIIGWDEQNTANMAYMVNKKNRARNYHKREVKDEQTRVV